ncbi:peptide synthetase [Sphaerisporangium krabiense]|uniref:Non-ribosomal peptide synthetase-like protein n=1 Tax=Sphaerisporangium krabiense TaxID=763782 RepID=A0A7W8Z0V6_9ACTN|nr:Pls/PosA family non-ribosomal peptide synthetase [Sphaerisporangium krabiense]MBB5625424.1 non-ribosomal peptide synthetase-like protein [Sphaerisporangium krabiense]GII64062.1 peptide synthetase [Sphaerisporangium krabiense]
MTRQADVEDARRPWWPAGRGRDARDSTAPAPAGAGRPGRGRDRLEVLFEEMCDRLRAERRRGAVAVDADGVPLTYDELDARANRLARHLARRGARPGDRIALLFDHGVPAYEGMLAVLKIGATYVPLDPGYPADRLAHILGDAAVRLVLTLSHLRDRLPGAVALCLDEAADAVAAEDGRRLTREERGERPDDLCYIVYTSGSTGRPKGVAVEHASICNFVRVAAEAYGLRRDDRVYQGMTIAFDFSVEEIWVPLMSGATLVPKPPGTSLVGRELREFLQDRGVTALCCVPTLLATLDQDVPGLRFLLVSGEACPPDLVRRWHRPGRRFLNVYGPTEATVTATWTTLHPGRPVTLGVPLPTYSVVILDPDRPRVLPPGELGEIGIAGVGLARGYLNRDDLTARAFIPDFAGLPDNPSGRIYRTGDLGRLTEDGEIEYHGRIDGQVQIHGYRVELAEIESVLLEVPGIAQAVAGTHEPEPGVAELVAYYSARGDAPAPDREEIYAHLRRRLPRYMIPAYLERLAAVPMLPSDKADRAGLPAPTGPRGTSSESPYAAPGTVAEKILADTLARVVHQDQVSVDDHFFDGLGANSMLMARFCARVREEGTLPPVSMKDVYLHPTVRSLAKALTETAPVLAPAEPGAPGLVAPRGGTVRYLLCGVLQLLLFLGYAYAGALAVTACYTWLDGTEDPAELYLRALACGCGLFAGLSLLPIVAKWSLIGRWRPGRFRVWTLAYLRFWTVKTLVRHSPMVLFAGSPLYLMYLRALGARIGPGAVILSRRVPVCTDLLTVGAGTVIRKDAYFSCYRARAGMIEAGPVTLGRDVLVGEFTVLDIGTRMEDGAQLGHSSSLHEGQTVPAGERWHGSPAQPGGAGHPAVAPARCGAARRFRFGLLQLLGTLLLAMPLTVAGSYLLGVLVLEPAGLDGRSTTGWGLVAAALAVSLLLFCGGVAGVLLLVTTVPRLLNLVLTPGRVYPLYGFHYWAHRTVGRLTNTTFLMRMFGDSSFIVHFLRGLGYDLSRASQTGSNFGLELKHESPYLAAVGPGTMVSDGLSLINADYSGTSFRLSPATIGAQTFLGNDVAYPSQSRAGDNCLLATKVMVPVDGPVRHDVGLLGSPCFEIPRSVQRDSRFDHIKTGEELRRRLAAKNRHNAVTIGLYLLVRWGHLFGATLLAMIAASLYGRFGPAVVAAGVLCTLVFSALLLALVEHAATGFRALRPRFCSIYQPYYWRHERFWKLSGTSLLDVYNGTPFKNLVWRLLGVRLGPRVFDDGCHIPERTLVSVGGDCTLSEGALIQAHSLEDGTFKSGRIVIGGGCTIGAKALVHYGVTMGEGAVLDADSFLMKGEEVAPRARWRGNPAVQT